MLTDKRLLVTGVVTTDSIAFATALRAQQLGAEIVLTALDRNRALCEQTATTARSSGGATARRQPGRRLHAPDDERRRQVRG